MDFFFSVVYPPTLFLTVFSFLLQISYVHFCIVMVVWCFCMAFDRWHLGNTPPHLYTWLSEDKHVVANIGNPSVDERMKGSTNCRGVGDLICGDGDEQRYW